jgi:cell division septal protein FtsQ
MKIVSTGSTLASPGFLEKKQKRRRRRQKIFLALAIILLLALVFVSRLDTFRINEVTVSGAKAVSADDVEEKVRESLSGYYLWLIPHDSSFLYGKGKIRRELEESFPRFSAIDISLGEFKTLNISVSEREPFALYCEDDSAKCYFLDQTGFIFDFAPNFSEGVYFIYSDAELDENPLGRKFLPMEEFMALSAFVSKLSQLSLVPLSLTMDQNEFEVKLKTGNSVSWQRGADLARTYSNLESFLLSPTIVSQRDFMEKVLELDLRTEDKVFYRFRE